MEARVEDLERQIARFERLADDAPENQLGSAVAALQRASDLRRDLHRVQVEIRNRTLSTEERLAADASSARADGSWVAAANLAKQYEEAKAERLAQVAEAEERQRRNRGLARERLATALRSLPAAELDALIAEVRGTGAQAATVDN